MIISISETINKAYMGHSQANRMVHPVYEFLI